METFVGDTVKLNLRTGIDITTYPIRRIEFKRPDGTTGYWTSTIDPLNNRVMTYTTIHSDLDQSGIWAIQAHVEDGFGAFLNGKFVEFTVYDPIAATASPATGAPTTAP